MKGMLLDKLRRGAKEHYLSWTTWEAEKNIRLLLYSFWHKVEVKMKRGN